MNQRIRPATTSGAPPAIGIRHSGDSSAGEVRVLSATVLIHLTV